MLDSTRLSSAANAKAPLMDVTSELKILSLVLDRIDYRTLFVSCKSSIYWSPKNYPVRAHSMCMECPKSVQNLGGMASES